MADVEGDIKENLLEKITTAIKNNDFSEVKSYIKKGFNVRFKAYRAFENAAENDNVEIYSHLWKYLEFKNDEEKNDIADYLFVESIVFEALEVLKFLSPYVQLQSSKRSPLLIAINTENISIINFVLSQNPVIIDLEKQTLNKIISLDKVEIFIKVRDKIIENNEIINLNCDFNEYTKLLAKEKIRTFIEQEEKYNILDRLLPQKENKTNKKKI